MQPPYLPVLVVGLVIALALMLRFLGRARHPVMISENDHLVTLADDIITHHRPGSPPESISLAALDRVVIETNDLGPFENDLFFILQAGPAPGTTGRCYIPQGTPGMEEVLEHLYALPGFDTALYIAAMGSTSGQLFQVWSRSGNSPHPC